ncbi:hypothetical protein F5Y16DRAFT_356164 [Xylariaceae sp. FL0255]|nr:hypothetical protein F5Y16DRAFT_356164 [Xylariaceae sp. FL0255]
MENQHFALNLTGPQGIPQLLGPSQSLDIPLQYDHQAALHSQENMDFPTPSPISGKENPISRFYNQHDGPWHPLGMSTESSRGQPLLPNVRGNDTTYGQGSPSIARSEFDSGYGSLRHRPSVTNGSACDDALDNIQDTQSIAGTSIADSSFHGPGNWRHSHPTPAYISLDTEMKCNTCSQVIRTKSEFKKHNSRHTKPFKCSVEGCPRRDQGFGTKNDLDRHKRSVHPGSEADGDRYVCLAGSCASREKIWPRADNFKAHLKRVHQKENVSEDELATFIYKPHQGNVPRNVSRPPPSEFGGTDYSTIIYEQQQPWPQPFDQSHKLDSAELFDQRQVGDHLVLNNSQQDLHDLNISSQLVSRQELYQSIPAFDTNTRHDGAPPVGRSHDQLELDPAVPDCTTTQADEMDEDVEVPMTEDHAPGRLSSVSGRMEQCGSQDNSILTTPVDDESDEAYEGNSDRRALRILKPRGRSPSVEPTSLIDWKNTPLVRKVVEMLESRGILGTVLEPLGYKKIDCQGPNPPKKEAESGTFDFGHKCSQCEKWFPRRCELKKHEKRHDKPYGCTFRNCDKKFGSKNDWKRHENTQHFTLETWKCIVDFPGGGACGKVCYSEPPFKAHLAEEHGIRDDTGAKELVERGRSGRNWKDRFWCGFCNDLIDVQDDSMPAWAERFNHIDEHYTGKEPRDISEWVEYDSSEQEKTKPKQQDSVNISEYGPTPPQTQPTPEMQPPPRKLEGVSKNGFRSGSKRQQDESGMSNGSKKKPKQLSSAAVWKCCQCGEILADLMLPCMEIHCQHKPCRGCQS